MSRSHHDVMARRCGECLFGKDRIVSAQRAASILRGAAEKDVPFLCHKGTIASREITCRGSWDADGGGRIGRMVKTLCPSVLRWIDPDTLLQVEAPADAG